MIMTEIDETASKQKQKNKNISRARARRPRQVVVPQLLRASLSVRTVYLRLLELCYRARRDA